MISLLDDAWLRATSRRMLALEAVPTVSFKEYRLQSGKISTVNTCVKDQECMSAITITGLLGRHE
jgi:hypothetical protein